MKKLALILAVLMAFWITGCSGDKIVLNVYNWGDYIDEELLDDFERKYPNIRVNYEMFETNEDMYAKLKNSRVKYDVLIPSDYMIEKLINEDMLLELDFNNIPNYDLIDENFKNLDYDPENRYSVPYMWGTLGILYNKNMVSDTNITWNTLFDPRYEQNVFMMDSVRDTLGVALKSLGYSFNSTVENELEEAKEKLIAQSRNVLSYTGDEVKDKMISGEAALAVIYSGDAVTCINENPDLAFALPPEGSNLFFDAMVIPKSSANKNEAELFINFMCETDSALRNVEYIGYSTPHKEAYEALSGEVKNSFAYPSDEDLEKAEIFIDLKNYTRIYDEIWTVIKASL